MAYNRGMSYSAEFLRIRCPAAGGFAPVAGVFALLFGWALSISAETVYRSVDENGVVSYSDTRPAGAVDVETLVIDVPAPQLTETEQQRLAEIRETTDRMVADRQQREKYRAELRQQQAASQPRAVEYVLPPSYGSSYYPVYYPYPVHRPGWRPDHPGFRPPLRPEPPGKVISPGYDYPASLVRRGYSPQVRAAFEK
jgi:hypothetical protein